MPMEMRSKKNIYCHFLYQVIEQQAWRVREVVVKIFYKTNFSSIYFKYQALKLTIEYLIQQDKLAAIYTIYAKAKYIKNMYIID